jgi:serine/threonine protein kinase
MPHRSTLVDEDGATIAMSEAEITQDDGATIAMPEAGATEEDGGTIVMPEDGLAEDDGLTKAMAKIEGAEDDGATKAMPKSETPEAEPGKGTVIIASLKVGQVLQERYQLDKMLGAGGFGAVYLAQDVKLKRACVVKQMLIPRDTSPKDIETYRANFEREADLLVQLNHPGHPNIPEIYDYFSDTSGNYLVMKYIEGRSLKDVLDQGEGKIPWREAVRYAVDVCDALYYMHTLAGEPVMHRDLKPANILLGDDGRVWLVDFGLAKAKPVEGADELGVTQAAGSIGYTPFEQWLGEARPPSDIYALGVTLHHLVTGLNPLDAFGGEFHIQKLQEMHGQFTSLRKVDRSLPRELEGIVKQTTAVEPGQRPTALQLKQQLEAMISGGQDVGLFTFKSGESAKTTGELVELCEQYRPEAEGYLYRGDFERWFTIINRNDLAEAAVQAVERGKNQKDGLEKFLKLIIPNLFLRRLGKASGHLTRVAVQVLLIFIIVVLFVALGGSYIARWFIQQSIGGYPWNYSALDLDRENRFTEQFLTEKFRSATQSYLNDIQVEVRSPDRLDIQANWAGIPLELPVTLQLDDKKPNFYLLEDIPNFLIADNISAGVNRGIDNAFQKGPVDVSSLEVEDGVVVFTIEPSGRAPFVKPTPVLIAGPTPTPTPVNLTLIAVFNDLDQDIILEIDGETWHILANDTKVIEKEPGTYNYTARYEATEQLAARGTISWARKVYRWHINLEDVE